MNQATHSVNRKVPQVAVIGAGISGLIAARTLADQGLKVTVFEKSRGVGGRMATRRGTDDSSFDHGAQYFTVRDEVFRGFVDSCRELGVVAAWPNRELGPDQKIVVIRNGQVVSGEKNIEPIDRFVGVPAMNSICKHLASGLEIIKQSRIDQIEPVNSGIHLIDEQGESRGSFDRLIVSAPAEQSSALLKKYPKLGNQLAPIAMSPCWATMATFETAITVDWVGAFLHDSFLSWAARNSSKPGRSRKTENLILHATPEWTSGRWEEDAATVALEMLEEFWRVTGLSRQSPLQIESHRWKYAIPVDPLGAGCFFDSDSGIAACGDWAAGSRVEGAYLSGLSAARRILESLAPSQN